MNVALRRLRWGVVSTALLFIALWGEQPPHSLAAPALQNNCPQGGGIGSGLLIENQQVSDCYDWGDAPDPTYRTLNQSYGAHHYVWNGTPYFLGVAVDTEADGMPTHDGLGDDASNDDEDGVAFPMPFVPGEPTMIEVMANTTGFLDAWIDFNGDGSWSVSDQVFTSHPLSAGLNQLPVNVPPVTLPTSLFARFRFSSVGGLSVGGPAPDGEVEDYDILASRGEVDCIEEDHVWLGDQIWRDVNSNGRLDAESGIAGVDVELWHRDPFVFPPFGDTFTGRKTMTDDNGRYGFACLDEGHYFVAVKGLEDFERTSPYKHPDDDRNGDQNCYEDPGHPSGAKFISGPVELIPGTEPDLGGKANVRLDCGFTCEAGTLDIALVIDSSGSMSRRSLREARSDAEDFIRALDPALQRVAVVVFDSSARVESELTAPLGHAISKVRDLEASGGTKLKTGIEEARDHLLAHAAPGVPQVMLILSDGQDSDKEGARSAARSARGEGILIATWGEGPSADQDFLRDIASSPDFFTQQPSKSEAVGAAKFLRSEECDDPIGGEIISCPHGSPTVIDISTGVYPWEVSSDGIVYASAKQVMNPPSPPWGSLLGAEWISRLVSGQSAADIEDYRYRVGFHLPIDVERAKLSVRALSDDWIDEVRINGQDLGKGTGGNGYGGLTYDYERMGTAGSWVYPGAQNRLELKVVDHEPELGGYTGLDLTGKVSYCVAPQPVPAPPPPSPSDPAPPMQVEIQVSAFIPYDNSDNPLNDELVGEGDIPKSHDRTARASNPYTTNGYRMRSRIVVNPIRAYDTGNNGVIERDSPQFNPTAIFHKPSSLDALGDLTDAARNSPPIKDGYLKEQEQTTKVREWSEEGYWLGDRVLQVKMRGSAAAAIYGGLVPGIDWDLNIIIDATDPENLEYTVEGEHDGFPSYDVIINCEDVYFSDVAPGKDIKSLWGSSDEKIDPPVQCAAGTCGTNFCE